MTKYLFSMGELSRKDNSIVFKNEKGNFYLPIESVREIYLLNEISLNTKFLDFISKAGITLHFFNYYGHYSGTFFPKKRLLSGNLIIKQVKAYETSRLIIAKAIVQGIANNIHEVLYHYFRHDKKELKDGLNFLKYEVEKWLDKDLNIKQILFIEGQIWYKFYSSFSTFLNDEFGFSARKIRPPDNPLNAMISFGNSLLYAKTISAIYNTHLEQSISYLHEPSDSRFSLSLDLCEVFKPILVFRCIFELANKRQIKPDLHFEKHLNYCLLNENGRKIFIQNFEDRLNETFLHSKLGRNTTYKNAIKLDGYKLIKFLLEGDEFTPFSLKDKR